MQSIDTEEEVKFPEHPGESHAAGANASEGPIPPVWGWNPDTGSNPPPYTNAPVNHPSRANPPPTSYHPSIPQNPYPPQPPVYYYPPPPPSYPYQFPYPTEPPPPQYYAPPPQYNPMSVPPPHEKEQRQGPSDAKAWVVAAAAVGSLVGLSAAAATRWWNGDDWYLVTPDRTKAPAEEPAEEEDPYTNRAMERPSSLPPALEEEEESLSQLRAIQASLASIQRALHEGLRHSSNESSGNDDSRDDPVKVRLNMVLDQLESILLGMEQCDAALPAEAVRAPGGEVDSEPCMESTIALSSPTEVEVNAMVSEEVLVLHLRQALAQLVLGKDGPSVSHAQFIAGVQLLYLYASNISNHPHLPRYRRIYCENESYRQNVEKLPGAAALLEALGFQLGPNSKYWEWRMPSSSERENVRETMYLARAREAVSALKVLKAASAAVDQEALLQSALHAAGLEDQDASKMETPSGNRTHSAPSEVTDADVLASHVVEAPFVCDTDLVTTEGATLLAVTDWELQGTVKSDEIPLDEIEGISENEVWK